MSTTTKTRPCKKPRKKQVSIRLDPAIHEQAEQLAKAEKRSFSQYVELALEQYMKDQELLTKYFPPGVVYPIFTPFGAEAAAEKLLELLKSDKNDTSTI